MRHGKNISVDDADAADNELRGENDEIEAVVSTSRDRTHYNFSHCNNQLSICYLCWSVLVSHINCVLKLLCMASICPSLYSSLTSPLHL